MGIIPAKDPALSINPDFLGERGSAQHTCMTHEEVKAFIEQHGRLPDIHEMHKAPICWIPTHQRNPSKLEAHKFVNGKWIPLGQVTFVPWPEAFPK